MTPAGTAVWNFGRQDVGAIAAIALLPIALAFPQLVGWLQADPILYTGAIALDYARGVIPGAPYIDPNTGLTTQALGYRAALDWLHGQVPWWNYYSGVGLPLAAEYQPAAFFPLTLLLLLPNGMVLQHLALQVLSGLGTYGLLRQLGVERKAAVTGALLYAFNGTLAIHSHAPAGAIPFLPWMLWGIERVRACVAREVPGGWPLMAAAMAMGLLCGFPEVSYLSGLLALAWAVLRGFQVPSSHRLAYAGRIALGGMVGMAIAAPQLLAFFHFLQHAYIGTHGVEFATAAFGWPAIPPSLVAPYVIGPPFGYTEDRIVLFTIWGGIGGFVTLALVTAAAHGLWVKRDALSWLLVGWCVLAWGKTFGIEPAVTLLNWVPGVTLAAFYRYAPPSWELALVILAVRGIDHIARGGLRGRAPVAAAAFIACAVFAGALLAIGLMWPMLNEPVALRNWAVGSLAWAAVTSLLVVAALAVRSMHAASAVAAVLVLDAAVMTLIPTLANPRAGVVDRPAIAFLQQNLGFQRFYTLGPIQPNYGAYFGIASINHNYLPVSKRWVDWLNANLDKDADQVVFNGNYPRKPNQATPAEELRRNLPAYEWVGVKYVVTFPHEQPFAGNESVRRVYADALMNIYELPGARPYFESEGGHCTVTAADRAHAVVACARADTLVRRELHFPGWRAHAGGAPAAIAEYRGLFQAIAVPAGRTEVRFDYAPPNVGFAWLVSALGLILAFAPLWVRRAPR